ncbi:MAG: DNA translocase FtsK 4TM domain-containing protein, partial [Oscillospiraceae bacterium]|nr:DNA translocase FtsK 4TM domain-containing protein [Oscillospiraceae bacterium]
MPKQKKKTAASKSTKSKQSTRAAGNAKKETPRIDHSAIMKNRMTGAIVCFFLAIFAALGYFSGDGLFISFFRKFLSGLLGWAFYAVTPALVIAGLLLALEKSRPVKLRVVFVLLVPAILSALLHALICKENYAAKFSIFGLLYKSGKAGESGGIIGGIVGGGFRALFGKAGAAIVFICLLIVAVFIIINRTPSEIIAALRKKKTAKEQKRAAYYEAYMQYEQEQEEKRAAAEAASAAVVSKYSSAKRPVIDIPVDDPGPAETNTKKQTAKKEGFFNKTPRVKTPDQVFADTLAAKERNEDSQQNSAAARAETAFQFQPVVPRSTVQPAGPAQEPASIRPGSVNIMRRENRQAAPPEPIPPEPAVQPLTIPEPPASAGPAQPAQTAKPEGAQKKITAEEAAAEQAKIAESIEKTMESVPQQPQYIFPPVTLLDAGDAGGGRDGREEARLNAGRLESTLSSFGINAQINNIVQGPAVTRYEFELEQGVKLNRLTNLSDDIALSLGASGVRIAPIPGKIAIVGIEVPNKLVSTVHLREIIESSEFRNSKSKVSFALGKDIGGSYIVGDISKLPHMLIAGTTGSGKSVCINSLIISLLYKAKPEEVRLILVDPKMVELGVYNGIPHLLIPVVTDPKKA